MNTDSNYVFLEGTVVKVNEVVSGPSKNGGTWFKQTIEFRPDKFRGAPIEVKFLNSNVEFLTKIAPTNRLQITGRIDTYENKKSGKTYINVIATDVVKLP